MGRVPGPAAGEGEAVGPPSRDSARVYLDMFTGPLRSIAAAQALLRWLGAVGRLPGQPRHRRLTSPLGAASLAEAVSLLLPLLRPPTLVPRHWLPRVATALSL